MTVWAPPEAFDGYRVRSRLGAGHMGQVFLGYDEMLDREVAIKFMRPEKLSPQSTQQFLDEAKAIARTQHQNIASVYRAGILDDIPYIVLEYIQGQPLSRPPCPMPVEKSLETLAAITKALSVVHKKGVVHGDIKPGNILIDREGVPKLIDFGLARIMGIGESPYKPEIRFQSLIDASTFEIVRSSEVTSDIEATADIDFEGMEGGGRSYSVTSPRAIMGTPDYMAPELWQGQEPTPQSDIYAIGAVLYKLIEGSTPFEDISSNDLPTAIQSRKAPRIQKAGVEVADIVSHCLDKRPGSRWRSALELYEALKRAKEQEVQRETMRQARRRVDVYRTTRFQKGIANASTTSDFGLRRVLPMRHGLGPDKRWGLIWSAVSNQIRVGLHKIWRAIRSKSFW